jgi:DNA-binding CsgD family transcriptional regulator
MTEQTTKFIDRFKRLLPAVTLAGAASFFAYDILVDLLTGIDSRIHITLEFIVFLAISAVLGAELLHINRLNQVIDSEKSKSARLAGEMIQVMHGQFSKWGLSMSEAEVALLLIKGLSMKEIAEARQVKEKTVRSQSAAIYAKSGQAGRHELAAFFIEDLMSSVATPAPDTAGLKE